MRAYARTRFVLFMRMPVTVTMPAASDSIVSCLAWKADQFPETSETPLEPPLNLIVIVKINVWLAYKNYTELISLILLPSYRHQILLVLIL